MFRMLSVSRKARANDSKRSESASNRPSTYMVENALSQARNQAKTFTITPLTKDEVKKAKKRSNMIDKQLKTESILFKKELNQERKIIILGTADSGKSTLLRQITLLHGPGFSDERDEYRLIIWEITRLNFLKLHDAIKENNLVKQVIGVAELKVVNANSE
jgi:ATPase subunit of ABC transporter with duplicated ATPase domains